MYLHYGTVQTYAFHPDSDDLFPLQRLEDPVQYPAFTPSVHPRIDRVPVAEFFGQAPPFAPLFGHIQYRFQYFVVAVLYVPVLFWE